MLHGNPGAGKTSYLQAGLLPYLEQESIGFRVLRDRSPFDTPVAERDYPILILRSTSDLAGQFADALSVFCAQSYVYTTPAGTPVTIDLPRIMREAIQGKSASTAIQPVGETIPDEPNEAISARELWIAMRDHPDFLARLLGEITQSLPFELVIAVDQGEELLTLVRTPQQIARRQKALDMLLRVAQAGPRCKIVFTLRSQSLGQLIGLLPDGRIPAEWRAFPLRPLTEDEMVMALLAPTNGEALPYTDEIPYRRYRFAFAAGLATQIVAQAIDAAADSQQSPLAIVHAAGMLLYDKQVVEKKQATLSAGDLKAMGGVKDALMRNLDAALQRLPGGKPAHHALRQLIGKLSITFPDGTLGRDVIPAGQLKRLWQGGAGPVEAVVNQAAEQQGLFEIQQLLIGGQTEVYVSLPQDSLAQLGKKIHEEKTLHAYGKSRIIDTLWIMVPLAFLCSVLSWYFTKNYVSGDAEAQTREEFRKDVMKQANEFAKAQVEEGVARVARRPLYAGLVAQADQALRADNALRARQLLLSQPAQRSFIEAKNKHPDLRGFEWHYLWNQLNHERFLFEGHRSIVTAVAISPDSQRAASGSIDGTVRVWNLKNGEVVAVISGPLAPIHAVAFAPDGKTLAAGGADKIVRLWDLSELKADFVEITKEAKSLPGHTDAINALAYGKDAQTLASAGADKSVILWDVAAGKAKHTLKEHKGAVHALAFANNDKTIASGGAAGELILWDAAAGKKSKAIDTQLQTITALAASPTDSKMLAVGGFATRLGVETGGIGIWDLADAAETSQISHGLGVQALAYAPDGKSIVSGGRDHVVRLWDIKTCKEQNRWIGHLGAVGAIAYAKDGSAIVSGSHDAKVKAWTPACGSGPDVIRDDFVSQTLSLALNPKNTLLASGGADGSVKLWNSADGKLLLELAKHPGAVAALAFSHHKDKTYLAVGVRDDKGDGEIKVWRIEADAKQGLTAKLAPPLAEQKKAVTSLAFCPAENKPDLLLSGSADQTVRLWDIETGKEKEVYRGHKDEVRAVVFGPDGAWFASAGKDQRVCLYEDNRKEFATLSDLHLASIDALAIVPEGDGRDTTFRLITAGADQTVRVWFVDRSDLAQPQRIQDRMFRPHTQPITRLVFNPNSTFGLIVTASWDGSIKLHDLQNERFTLLGHAGPVRALALASDQSFLASAGHDGAPSASGRAPRRTAANS